MNVCYLVSQYLDEIRNIDALSSRITHKLLFITVAVTLHRAGETAVRDWYLNKSIVLQ